jgi:hypothetical protein
MTRHRDEEFDRRDRQGRGFEERGPEERWGGRQEFQRGERIDDRRYEDEPWASRERGGWGEEGRGGQAAGARGAYNQGGYWQDEATSRGHGEFRRGSYPDAGTYGRDYAQRGPSSGWGQEGASEGDFYGNGERGWMSGGRERGRDSSWMGVQERWPSGPHAGRGPKGYQRPDERIKEEICECLTRHGQIDASDIEVKVSNREVTLTGTVPGRQAKRMAEDLAESVSGVTDVHNQLRVSAEHTGQQGQPPMASKPGREGQQQHGRIA